MGRVLPQSPVARPDGGAAGCVVWSGVPVRNVVAALGGVASGMAYVTARAARSCPKAQGNPLTVLVERLGAPQAMEDAILAWEMNGEPLCWPMAARCGSSFRATRA